MKCRQCDREYTYNDIEGYSKELCGPLCDGIEIGRKQAAKRCKEIAQQRYLAENQAVSIDLKISEEFNV